ncbi:acyltransferase [Pontibacter sp. MBLB2868]|uniref:acyltransferase n=1 Tax=Pontibacter sp. MBLB2868 TaxID=3451555 RepID=UPI003F74E24F
MFLIAKNKLKEIELEDYVYSLLHGSTYYFWYVYFILLVYTLMPLLRILVKYFQPSVNQILLLICITTFVLKLLPSDVQLVNTIINYLIYLQYIVFGYCLTSGSKTWWQNNIYFGLLLVVSGFVITLFGTYFLSDKTGEFQDFFYQSSTTHIFLKAVGIWILFNRLTASIPANAIALLRMLSKFSFGIFLIHQLVIENVLIVRLGISHNFIHPAVGMLLTTVLCFIISSFILYILTKLQLGKYVC